MISCHSELLIIKDIDPAYLSIGETDKNPEFLPGSYGPDYDPRTNLKLKELFNKVGPGEHKLSYELYLNESGLPDKVRVIEGIGGEFDQTFIHSMSLRKYKPAQKANENVKVRFISTWLFRFGSEGECSINDYNSFDKLPEPEQHQEFYSVAEVMPVFSGGDSALMEFLSQNISYPEDVKKEGIEGRVYVKAYIDNNGDVAFVEILKGVDARLDNIAVSAVKKAKFIPAKQNGKPVKVYITIPIRFMLK